MHLQGLERIKIRLVLINIVNFVIVCSCRESCYSNLGKRLKNPSTSGKSYYGQNKYSYYSTNSCEWAFCKFPEKANLFNNFFSGQPY